MFFIDFQINFQKNKFSSIYPLLFWFSCFLSFKHLYHFGNLTPLLRGLVSFFVEPNNNCSVG